MALTTYSATSNILKSRYSKVAACKALSLIFAVFFFLGLIPVYYSSVSLVNTETGKLTCHKTHEILESYIVPRFFW